MLIKVFHNLKVKYNFNVSIRNRHIGDSMHTDKYAKQFALLIKGGSRIGKKSN